MSGRVCVITGTTHGIGMVTARELAASGSTVVMACRDPLRAGEVRDGIVTATGNRRVHVVGCDLASFASIRAAAAAITSEFPVLDVLVNNAGMMAGTRTLSADGHELTWATNYLGPYLLTRLVQHTLARPGARIVNVASRVHYHGSAPVGPPAPGTRFRGMHAYAQSKLALVMFTLSLAERTAGSGLTVNCLHPGVVATNILPDSRPWLKAAGRIAGAFMLDAEHGARTTLTLANDPALATVSGRYFDEKARERPPAAAALDRDARETLWRASAEVTGVDA